jgi:hypothetical protein
VQIAGTIVYAMIPLAVSGPLIIAAVVSASVLSLWWLLRGEAREAAEEPPEEGEEPRL